MTTRKKVLLWFVVMFFGSAICYAAEKNNDTFNRINADAYYALGQEYEQQGKFLDAIEEYHKAIRLEPDHADSYYRLGLISEYKYFPREPQYYSEYFDESIEALQKFLILVSVDDPLKIKEAKQKLSYLKYRQGIFKTIISYVKILRPILLYGFPLIFLFLVVSAIRTKRIGYTFAVINFLIVSPITFFYATDLGEAPGFALMIPIALDLPFCLIGEIIASVVSMFMGGYNSELFYRLKAILYFPILGTVQWYLIGYYLSKKRRKR